VKLEWGGDVDLGDGEVQKEHEKYLEQISLIKGIVRNANAPDERALIVSDLKSIKRSLDKQLCFAPEAIKKANDRLCEKLSAGKRSTDKELATLSLTVDELGRLNTAGRSLYIEVDAVITLLEDPSSNLVQSNVARRIVKIRDDALYFVQGISRHERSPATHVLVTMVSPTQRNRKPYALPVSCIPYAGLTDTKARRHINDVIMEMTRRHMKVAGKLIPTIF